MQRICINDFLELSYSRNRLLYTIISPCKHSLKIKPSYNTESLRFIGCTQMHCTYSVLYTHQLHTPSYPHLKLPRLRFKSMYQSSESRWDRNPLIDLWSQSNRTGAGLPQPQKTHGDGPMGDNCGRESRRLHLTLCRLLCGSLWWCSRKNHGVVFRELTQTDRGQWVV